MVSISLMPAFSTKEYISPMAVVPYGVRLEQKESEPMVSPMPFAFAFLKVMRYYAVQHPSPLRYRQDTGHAPPGCMAERYVLNHSFKKLDGGTEINAFLCHDIQTLVI